MAKITIKRTTGNNLPTSLEFGELAYVQGTNKLVIGNQINNVVELNSSGSNKRTVTRLNISNNYTIANFENNYFYFNPSNDNLIITLPTTPVIGNFFIIRNINSTNRIIINANNNNLFNLGLNTNGYESDITYDGEEWQVTIY